MSAWHTVRCFSNRLFFSYDNRVSFVSNSSQFIAHSSTYFSGLKNEFGFYIYNKCRKKKQEGKNGADIPKT